MKLSRAVVKLADDLTVQVVEVDRLPPLRAEPQYETDVCARCGYQLDEGACLFCAGSSEA